MSKQYPNIVPAGAKTQSLGTAAKPWDKLYAGTVNADEFAGGLADIIDTLATKAALSTVEGLIENASAPNYFSEDEPFSALTASNRTTLATPNILWLNINNKGHKLTAQQTFDIANPSVWDTKATAWAASTDYAVGDYVYASEATSTYMYKCTAAGTSSTLTPSFPTTLGETYNDGSVVWECVLNYANGANRAGKDFYIYAIYSDTNIPSFTISPNSTVPENYEAETSRKVGGFHCLCVDTGTNVATTHSLYNYLAGDILPASVWDCYHRPVCAPEGMTYDADKGIWVDIYLASYTGTIATGDLKLETIYNATTADGTSTEKFHWYKFAQYFAKVKKRLPIQEEFMSFSTGSNQATAIKGAADVGVTGGHVDTAGTRMISNIGCEDCCGFQDQWTADDSGTTTGTSWVNQYSNDDGTQLGAGYSVPARALVGGGWSDSSHCGSRFSFWSYVPLTLNAAIGARGCAEPVHVEP